MVNQKVFLVGATGETGGDILEALIEDGSFDITCFIRTASAGKPAVKQLEDRDLGVVTGDVSGPIEDIVALLQGIDTVISTIFPLNIAEQIPLIDAAVQAGVKRFLPCNWATPSARGGILQMRDLKEDVHDHIFRHRLGFTIIDVGFWYQQSFPRVPSGKFDHAVFTPMNEVFAGGTAPNMLIDKRDVGRITARIIKDERTMNKRVYAYGDLLSQNEIHGIIEKKSGEKLELTPRSAEEIRTAHAEVKKALKANPTDITNTFKSIWAEYCIAKFVRADNTPENAEYLGYIDGRELYPDFQFIKFEDFVDELIAGKGEKPYPHFDVIAHLEKA